MNWKSLFLCGQGLLKRQYLLSMLVCTALVFQAMEKPLTLPSLSGQFPDSLKSTNIGLKTTKHTQSRRAARDFGGQN